MLNLTLKEIADPQIFSIGQDGYGTMLFVSRQGILIHDGESMEILKLPAIPFSLKTIPGNPIIYVGCKQQFGYLKVNPYGNYEYHRLSGLSYYPGDVIRISNTSDFVFFAGDYALSKISLSGNTVVENRIFSVDSLLTGLFNLNERIYLQFNGEGLVELSGEVFKSVLSSEVFVKGEIMFGLPYDQSRVLIGTTKNELLLFDGRTFSKFSTEYDSYLKESILIGAALLGDDKIAFSTMLGGVAVAEKGNGKKVLILSNNTGLPNDEIFTINSDRDGGLWISHESGLTRGDFNFPVKSYHNYSGLSGSLLTLARHNGKLYAGGNDGVFVLTEKRTYLERELIVSAPEINLPKITSHVTVTTASAEPQEKAKKGFLSRLLNVFKKDAQVVDEAESIAEKTQDVGRRKRIYSLQSVSHQFERIKGINEKCKQLLLTKTGLIAVTNTGVYLIDENRAILIKKDSYIRFAAVSLNPESFFVVGGRGIYLIVRAGNKWLEQPVSPGYEQNLYSLVETTPGTLWLGSDNLIQKIQIVRNKPPQIVFIPVERMYFERVHLKNVNDTLFVFLSDGVYFLENNNLVSYFSEGNGIAPSQRIISGFRELFWLKVPDGWVSVAGEPYNKEMDEFLGVFKNIQHLFYDELGELWVLDENKHLYKILSPFNQSGLSDFSVYIKKISNQQEMKFPLESLVLKYENSSLEFTVSAPGFIREGSTQYQYILDGLMKNWSNWNSSNIIPFPVIPPGKYILRVRARNVLGQISNEQSVSFEIKPPFTQTPLFFMAIGLLVLLLFLMIMKAREVKLRKDKRLLEVKVKERTVEIEEQKNEIEKQKSKIEIQHNQIFLQNKEITDSIFYARRIQSAVMPSLSDFDKIFPQNFVLFQPKDIVSGDFYWFKSIDNKAIVVAADCTGHGVPGAFMSMLGITMLNDLVIKTDWSTASGILDELRTKVKETLSQKGIAGEATDGMDISLCLFDFQKKTVDFAGAFTTLYIFRNGILMEYKADRMPIGIHLGIQGAFTNHRIDLLPGDIFYMFSDGYYSQIGGKDGKRFLSGNFKKLLQEIHSKPLNEQSLILEKKLDEWMGAFMQVDDILVMGFRYR